jgi:bacteriorhodopsin
MIVTGLVGALVTSSYKWGYFVIAMIALFGIFWNVVIVAKAHALAIGPVVHRTFLYCGVWTMFLWFIYPIAWGLSEGGNVISPDSEAVFYGILDILAKPVFGALLLFGHRNIDPASLGLIIRDYEDAPMHEKNAVGVDHHPNGGMMGNNTTTGNTVAPGTTATSAV